ncbi:MAG: DUF6370 family protein [Phycisphaerae bacterium]
MQRAVRRTTATGVACLSLMLTACQFLQPRETTSTPTDRSARMVEAGCAMCIFHMPGIQECRLAARIDDRSYLVRGSSIDDHGDAHAADGLCNTARSANVWGVVDGGYFVAEQFELVR